MNLKDINAEITFELWMKPKISGEKCNKGIGFISVNYTGETYVLTIGGKLCKVSLLAKSKESDLNFHLKRGCAHLAEVIEVAKDDSALVKIIFFNGEIVEIGDVEIGIDDYIKDTAERNGIKFNDIAGFIKVLNLKCIIKVGEEYFFSFMNGPAINDDFEENQHGEGSNSVVQENDRAFSLYGERVTVPVEKRRMSESKEIFFATKAIFKDSREKEAALKLARGKLTFSDHTKTGAIQALAAASMRKLIQENDSYLKKWDEYGAMEGEMLLKRAKAVGIIRSKSQLEKTKKGIKLFMSPIPAELNIGDQLEIASEKPLYLKQPEISWQDYHKVLEDEFRQQKKIKSNHDEAFLYTTILNLSTESIELEWGERKIPSDDTLFVLSINGYKIQIERRMKAREAILKGRSANPLLGVLLEEGGVLPDTQRLTKLNPLSSFVKNKIFKHPPTEKQKEAISIALNTPDIALIQGPPGTGKTTVITAVLERLNEEYDKTNSIKGQVLVSGFQHDAVENIVSRLSINALPAVKFGKRANDSEFTIDAVSQRILVWGSDIAKKIRKKNPQITQTEEQQKLFTLFMIYSSAPSKNNTISLMKGILDLPRDIVSKDMITQAEMIQKTLEEKSASNSRFRLLRCIRALRCNRAGFEDDGAARVRDLLDEIEDNISEKEIDILEKASRWQNGQAFDFLDELESLKQSLLDRCLPPPPFRKNKVRDDVLSLVAQASELLKKKLSFSNQRDLILAEFLRELEDNPDGVREAVEEYNFAYAATTQQALGKDIICSKTKKFSFEEKNKIIRYDTVIIDEAARVSPRDLLIPMSQAEKRIILVGDHRQLPHLIDEQIVRSLEDGNSSETEQDNNFFIRKSMFEYLFKRLKKLEKKDKIKRTVTLDAQYRTHPLLGDFVCNNFYKKYDEAYTSPLPKTDFQQELEDIANKAAVWIKCPYSKGVEQRLANGSRKRETEALIIADYLKKWIDSEAGSKLSFGVISFYKAQIETVYKALQKHSITQETQDNSWQINDKYRFFKNGEERLRIGTVDAFQGMEFDIVFLSMVRSQNMNTLPPHIRNEQDVQKKQQKLFGHLMSENRLCVSMSRQKKVLIIVGDNDLVQHKIATLAVPALQDFYNLCSQVGKIL